MNAELLFDLCGKLVLPAWILLMFLPKWDWTQKLISHAWIPSLLALAYIFCFYSAFTDKIFIGLIIAHNNKIIIGSGIHTKLALTGFIAMSIWTYFDVHMGILNQRSMINRKEDMR